MNMHNTTEPAIRRFERSLPISLLRARAATTQLFRAQIDRHSLTLPQWRVLRALAETQILDAKTLSERCVILPPSLTRILRALIARGLIAPVESPDARRFPVRLTEAGHQIFETVMADTEPVYRELAASFGAERLELLITLLGELRDTANAMQAQSTGRGRSRLRALR
ncbi:MAG: MarR family transcriptional regulator [Roseinatronobacter sp.]